MPRSGRRRESLVLLLVLAAGFATAFASAASAREMNCCAEGPETKGSGCVWLGAGDCCTESPAAPSPSTAAPPAQAAIGGVTPFPVAASLAALAVPALGLASTNPGQHTTVLRL